MDCTTMMSNPATKIATTTTFMNYDNVKCPHNKINSKYEQQKKNNLAVIYHHQHGLAPESDRNILQVQTSCHQPSPR